MKRIRFVSVCGSSIGIVPLVQSQTVRVPRSVDDLVRAALERNAEYLAVQQRLRLQEAQGLLRQAGIRPNPTVELEAAEGRVLALSGEADYTAGFFQPIETGGKRGRRIDL